MSWRNEPRYWKDIEKVDPQGTSAIPPASSATAALIGTHVSNIGPEATLKLVYAALKGPLHGKSPKALLKIIDSGHPDINQQAVTEPASMSRVKDGKL